MEKEYVTAVEYARLIQQLVFFDTTRNTLLTFSFTAVLAVLGIAISEKNISAWVCLVPFFLIIPFSARIAYYRLAAAHIDSFLESYAPERRVFQRKALGVPENRGTRLYPLIAWLVNHEMLLLAFATDAVFGYQYLQSDASGPYSDCLALVIPLASTVLVFIISNSTYNFEKIKNAFSDKWLA